MDRKTFWADARDFIHENSVQLVIGIISSLIAGTISSFISIFVTAVFFQEKLNDGKDAVTRAELRSADALYAEVRLENQQDSMNSLSLCRNESVQETLDATFTYSPRVLSPKNQDWYIDITYDPGGVLLGTSLSEYARNGCVSNSFGDWVIWADLSTKDGVAWCIDSRGNNGEVDANGSATDDIYAIDINLNGDLGPSGTYAEDISCDSIGSKNL